MRAAVTQKYPQGTFVCRNLLVTTYTPMSVRPFMGTVYSIDLRHDRQSLIPRWPVLWHSTFEPGVNPCISTEVICVYEAR
jgi:hypothetical protein